MKLPAELHVTRAEPWWRTGSMWLVLGLPAVVVVGALVTLGIALAYPDVVVVESGQGTHVAGKAGMPAQAGRNHAMTPDKAVPGVKD